MDKAELRAHARSLRRAIPAEARAAKDDAIAQRVVSLPEIRAAKAVACYVSVRSEVATTRILRELLARGTLVAVPALVRAHGDPGTDEPGAWRMQFARLQHPWGLKTGALGIPEPVQPWEDVDGDRLDAIVVPGVAFTRDGARLGNGGGYFDRYLAQHPKARRIGIAFAEQVVERIPHEPHDAPLDVLVTDAETLRFPRPPG